eukprot:COSAG01_NODE_3678_length_5803_cov_60.798738_4_plen_56_part_00
MVLKSTRASTGTLLRRRRPRLRHARYYLAGWLYDTAVRALVRCPALPGEEQAAAG